MPMLFEVHAKARDGSRVVDVMRVARLGVNVIQLTADVVGISVEELGRKYTWMVSSVTHVDGYPVCVGRKSRKK